MANTTKTFLGSDLTPTGDAAIVGDNLQITAAVVYDLATVLAGLNSGDDIPGWTPHTLGGGATTNWKKQTYNGRDVGQLNGNIFGAWANAHHSAGGFADGHAARVTVPGTNREFGIVRYDPTAVSGYGMEVFTSAKYANGSQGVAVDGIGWQNINTFELHKYWGTFPYAGEYSFDVCARALSDGQIELACWLVDDNGDEQLIGKAVDGLYKTGGTSVGVQTNGTGRYYNFQVFNPLAGGFTLTATPQTLTAWSKICLCGDLQYSSNKDLSDLLEYSVDGGGSWNPVPDDGDISGASTVNGSIQVRAVATIKNDVRPTSNTYIDAISIEINGTWDAAATPDAPTGLTAGTPAATSVPLTWTDPASGERILLFANTENNSATASPIAWAEFGDEAATACGLMESTENWFWAKTVSADGALSAFSDPATATTAAGAPDKPTALQVTSQGEDAVALSWTAGSGAAEYWILRAKRQTGLRSWAAFEQIGTAAGTTYTDNAANSDPDPEARASYLYAVLSAAGSAYSKPSNPVLATFESSSETGLEFGDYFWPLQKAIFDRLVDTAPTYVDPITGETKAVPIWGAAPKDLEFPAILAGEVIAQREISTKTRCGFEIVYTVHVLSDYQGVKQAAAIAETVARAITSPRLSLVSDGYKVVVSKLQGTQPREAADGEIVDYQVQLYLMIYEDPAQKP